MFGKEKVNKQPEATHEAEQPDVVDIEASVEEGEVEDPVEDMRKQNAEILDKLQRTLAEFDNYRKRTAKEKAYMYDEGVKEAVSKLLPIVDNFERALNTAEKDTGLYKGVEMIFRQLCGYLDDLGITPIEAKGEQFNPSYHNAVVHVDDEAFGDNEIVEELQKGYMYKDKVVRVSMVKVAN